MSFRETVSDQVQLQILFAGPLRHALKERFEIGATIDGNLSVVVLNVEEMAESEQTIVYLEISNLQQWVRSDEFNERELKLSLQLENEQFLLETRLVPAPKISNAVYYDRSVLRGQWWFKDFESLNTRSGTGFKNLIGVLKIKNTYPYPIRIHLRDRFLRNSSISQKRESFHKVPVGECKEALTKAPDKTIQYVEDDLELFPIKDPAAVIDDETDKLGRYTDVGVGEELNLGVYTSSSSLNTIENAFARDLRNRVQLKKHCDSRCRSIGNQLGTLSDPGTAKMLFDKWSFSYPDRASNRNIRSCEECVMGPLHQNKLN